MTNATLVRKETVLTLNTCRNCGHVGTNEEVAYEPAIMSRDYYKAGGDFCIDIEACKARAAR